MNKSFATWMAGCGAAAILLASCGGNSSDETASDEASPEQEKTTPAAVTLAEVETCLSDAGLKLATGKTPLISGVEGIGINPGDGPLRPGNVTAAVFVYEEDSEAKGAAKSLEGTAFGKIAQRGNTMTIYASTPAPEVRTAVNDCT